jgi:hypothetical protein
MRPGIVEDKWRAKLRAIVNHPAAALIRDSPDEPQTGVDFCAVAAF